MFFFKVLGHLLNDGSAFFDWTRAWVVVIFFWGVLRFHFPQAIFVYYIFCSTGGYRALLLLSVCFLFLGCGGGCGGG